MMRRNIESVYGDGIWNNYKALLVAKAFVEASNADPVSSSSTRGGKKAKKVKGKKATVSRKKAKAKKARKRPLRSRR